MIFSGGRVGKHGIQSVWEIWWFRQPLVISLDIVCGVGLERCTRMVAGPYAELKAIPSSYRSLN